MPDTAEMTPEAAERYFAEAFVLENRRERLAYELAHPKKRYRALSRFCHQAETLLDPARIRIRDGGTAGWAALTAFAAAHDAEVTVVSPDPWLDGLSLPFTEAVRRLPDAQDAAILIGPGFAVVRAEPMRGPTPLYLLTEA